jgi:hypothetical protein
VTRLGWGLVTVVSLIPGELWGGLYKTQKQALAEAFPGGGIERKSAFLTDGQAKKIEELARARLDSKIIHYYVGLGEEGRPGGAAFFDTHVVRTTTETVMVLLKPDGTVRRVEILAFYEPEDYKVRQRWLDRMNDEDLSGWWAEIWCASPVPHSRSGPWRRRSVALSPFIQSSVERVNREIHGIGWLSTPSSDAIDHQSHVGSPLRFLGDQPRALHL